MHWRPDAVTKTGVIQPMWIRQLSPVDMARHTIDPFIASVRGPGPAVNPSPSPEDVAYAAGALAKQFRQGKGATIAVGTDKVKVTPTTQCGGIVGVLAQAARELAKGGTVAIEFGGRRVIVCNSGPGGSPVVSQAPSAAAQAAQSAPQEVSVRPTPMPVNTQPAMTTAPSPSGFGRARSRRQFGVPEGQYIDYLRPTGPGRMYNAYRIETSDSPYRSTMMNSVRTFAPQAAMQTHEADHGPLYLQRTEPAAAMASRPAMPSAYNNERTPYEAQVRPTPMPMNGHRRHAARDYNLPGGTPAGQHLVR
jgi:hypothetical protein